MSTDYDEKKICVTLGLFAMFLLSGCSLTKSTNNDSLTGNTEESTAVPSSAIMADEGNKIKLNNITLTLPDGLCYGKQETEYGASYYVWKSDIEYVVPSSADIMLYVYEGTDEKTPDAELKDSEAKTSITSYVQSFISEVEDPRISYDAGLTSNNDWFTFCFTGYGGNSSEVTTYGTYCYPKSYYGIYMLEKSIDDNYSRDYCGFVFSNDGAGDFFSKKEYASLFNQIKEAFKVESFFTIQQLNYDASKDFSDGYSYKQLKTLFKNTTNYYIITGVRSEESSDGDTEDLVLSPLYDVVRVVDGDTIVVSIDEKEVTVRLIGVDTPESVHEDERKNTAEGDEASFWMADRLVGKQVYLEYDKQPTDDYGRTLAYVYLDDGKTMVNRLLLENGLARVMTVEPNSRYADDFISFQTTAREKGVGFWGTGFFETEDDTEDETQN